MILFVKPTRPPMRYLLSALLVVCCQATPVSAQDAKANIDRQVSDALRDVHDRGADLYNTGDSASGYHIYQGGLIVARGMLGHRSDLQKLIADGLAAAERQPSVARRAFMLHELIEQVRGDLRAGAKKGTELLAIPPREVKPAAKPESKSGVKPTAGVGEVTGGIVGRVIWQGSPVAGVEVTFVTLGQLAPRVYETITGSQGVYMVADLPPGKYIVLITPGPKAEVKKLPERYATSTTSPLRIDVKGSGEKLDFVLQ
jgi:hypothetical protein